LFTVNASGGVLNHWNSNNTHGLRPVLNLRADTQFTGTGSESDPFVVS